MGRELDPVLSALEKWVDGYWHTRGAPLKASEIVHHS
jgi:hypothetical protein